MILGRVSRRKKNQPAIDKVEIRIWKTALYVRLSKLNGGHEHDSSIEYQITYLRDYIRKYPELKLVDIYKDNGITGRTFNRTDFQRLMMDVIGGRIDCIVVKDLSRFGRNYLEAGEYLEEIFPMMGIRFIAINDGYDSASAGRAGLMTVPLKDMLNEMYSRDLSRKVRAVIQAKKERGALLNYVPFGYMKNPKNREYLVLDFEISPVVRAMFERKARGDSCRAIADWLNGQKVVRNVERRRQLGDSRRKPTKRAAWIPVDVKKVLTNPVYTGDMVYHRFIYEGEHNQCVGEYPREEWQIVRGVHPAIVDYELWESVQQKLSGEYAAKGRSRRKEEGAL